MAREEVLRGNDLVRRRAALDLARGDEDICEGNQKYVVVNWRALGGYGALEEGGQEGV